MTFSGQDCRVDADGLKVEEEGLLVVGIAICWNYHDSYYLSFKKTNPAGKHDWVVKCQRLSWF